MFILRVLLHLLQIEHCRGVTGKIINSKTFAIFPCARCTLLNITPDLARETQECSTFNTLNFFDQYPSTTSTLLELNALHKKISAADLCVLTAAHIAFVL